MGGVADHGVAETRLAIQSAFAAFQSWKKTTAKVIYFLIYTGEGAMIGAKILTTKGNTEQERHDLLLKLFKLMTDNTEDLGAIITLENGKPFGEGKGEVGYAASFLEWFAEEAVRD